MVALAAILLVTAASEPTPGRHALLQGLAGDWSIRLGGDCEVGPSPEIADRFTIFHWVDVQPNGRAPVAVVTQVFCYSLRGESVIAVTDRGVVRLDVATLATEVLPEGDPEIASATWTTPRPSLRYRLTGVATASLVAGFTACARRQPGSARRATDLVRDGTLHTPHPRDFRPP